MPHMGVCGTRFMRKNGRDVMDDKELFVTFARQLSEWSRSGKEPELGDWNVRAYLDMQERRLKEKEIMRIFDFKPDGRVYKVGDYALGMLLNGYNKRVNYALGEKKIEYIKDGKTIFRENRKVPLYQMIKWPSSEDANRKDETYVCPNCGHIERLETLESEGCQYCGTRFVMSQLYPKVTNFYTLENTSDKKRSIKDVIRLIPGCLVVALVLTFFMLFADTGTESYSFMSVFPVSYILMFLLGIWFSPVITEITENVPVSIGVAGAKRKITSKLRRYDEAFSYEYFEGKALSLLQMIVYADDPMNYIQFEGQELSPFFRDIVDMEYRGGVDVKEIKEAGEYIEVILKVFMKNTYYIKGKCKKKNETMYLHLRHHAKWKVEPNFSIVKVSCHGCGGSFDATKQRNCPYCQKEYDAGIDDWTVLDLWIHK